MGKKIRIVTHMQKNVSRTNLGFYAAALKIIEYSTNKKFSKFDEIEHCAKAMVPAKCPACAKK